MEVNFQNTENETDDDNEKEEEGSESGEKISKKRKLNEEKEVVTSDDNDNDDDDNDDDDDDEDEKENDNNIDEGFDNDDDDDDVNDEKSKNDLNDQLLLNILNHLIKNKIHEKKGFLSQLSNFLDCDHDERGKFIQRKKYFIPKIRRLCIAMLNNTIDVPLRHYERQIIRDIAKKHLHKNDEIITLVENLTFHRILRKVKAFLLQNKKK